MKYHLLAILTALLLTGTLHGQNTTDTTRRYNLLSGRYSYPEVKELLQPRTDWKPFPTYQQRAAWEQLPDEVKQGYIREAEQALKEPWEVLPATLFLEFAKTGNRSRYQQRRSARRSALRNWVLAECLEGKGRFLEAIANGMWAICEETYWGVPAHLYLQAQGPGLPDVEEPTVDLFAAETSALLAWTDYLLNEALDEFSPLLRPRVKYEIDRKILEPLQDRDDFWWMGFSQARLVNNWNPWIISNWLATVLLLEKDSLQRARHTHKAMRSLDYLLNNYPSDGGCDEGPGYWGHAGGSVFDCLEILQGASDGRINIYDQPLIQRIGSYIYKVFIDDHYFVNFADAPAKVSLYEDLVFRYGRQLDDTIMMQLGAFQAQQRQVATDQPTSGGSMYRHLEAIFNYGNIRRYPAEAPFVRDAWLPDLQVMTARSEAGTARGFFVAAKGGHNAESHNHNDVGNFIVYYNGYPVVVDVGVEEYTKKTFSPERYTIWTMQSGYHNLPTINGKEQQNGRDFQATNISYHRNEAEVEFLLNIGTAYPEKAQVDYWHRALRFQRDKGLTVVDSFALQEVSDTLQQNLMTAYRAEVLPDRIKLTNRTASDASPLYVEYDSQKVSVVMEEIPITDARLKQSWSHPLTRLRFVAKKPISKDVWTFRIVDK